MKIGDKLYCYNDYYLNITIGRIYTVSYIDKNDSDLDICITSDKSDEWISSDKKNNWYYGNFFYTLVELRNMKLKELSGKEW